MRYQIPRILIRKGSRYENYVVELIKRSINAANSRDERRHPMIRRQKEYNEKSAKVSVDVVQVVNPTGHISKNLGQATIEYKIESAQAKDKRKIVVHASGPIPLNGGNPASIDARIMELVDEKLVSNDYRKSGTGPYTYQRLY